MILNPLTFTGFKVEKDPQGFIIEMEKIFKVMYATDSQGVKFVAYYLKDVAYQWYEEWVSMRGDYVGQVVWDDFAGTFLDHFFSQELREAKAEEFVNLKQDKMSMKEYALKFQKFPIMPKHQQII